MESIGAGAKSDAPAVLLPEPEPEPEPLASAVGGVTIDFKKDAEAAGSDDLVVSVNYTPFTPDLQLPSVEYQQAATRVHTSSWPPNRDAPKWVVITALVLGGLVTLVGNVPFGVVALVLAALGACGRGKWGGRWWAISGAAVAGVGLLVAVAGWGVLAAWLVRSAALTQKYCTEENYSWRTSQDSAACQCAASSWHSVTMCCEYDMNYSGNSTCCLTVYDTEDKNVETLCGPPGY